MRSWQDTETSSAPDVVPAANDLVVENMRDPVFVLDQRSRVIGVNAAARQLVGPTSDGLMGQPLVDLLPEAESGAGGARAVG